MTWSNTTRKPGGSSSFQVRSSSSWLHQKRSQMVSLYSHNASVRVSKPPLKLNKNSAVICKSSKGEAFFLKLVTIVSAYKDPV